MLEASTEDALAAIDLLHVTGADGPPDDPFDARDLDYIRATLPALRTMSQVYFRADVSGLERIPASGPCCSWGPRFPSWARRAARSSAACATPPDPRRPDRWIR